MDDRESGAKGGVLDGPGGGCECSCRGRTKFSGSRWKCLRGPYPTAISPPPISGVIQHARGAVSGMSSGGRSGSMLFGGALDGGCRTGGVRGDVRDVRE